MLAERLRAMMPGNAQNSVLLRNAVSLYLLQGVNIAAPLVALPYLTRTLGLAGFGIIAYAMSLVQLVTFVMEFSFNLVATRRVSTLAGDPSSDELSRLYSAVMVVKIGIGLAGVSLLALAVLSIPGLREYWVAYLAFAPMVLGELLLPVWLFQGMQRMQYLPALSAISRAASLIAMFALVRTSRDLPMAAFVQALPYFIAGALAQLILWSKFKVRFRPYLPLNYYRALVHEASQVFLARLAGQIYTRGALIVLGMTSVAMDVGRFSIVQRISGVIVATIVAPLSQTLYPHLCRVWERDRLSVWAWRRRMLVAAAVSTSSALLAINMSSDLLARLLTGGSDAEFQVLLLVFSPALALTVLNTLLATVVMAMRRYAEIGRVVLAGAGVFLVLGIPFAWAYGALGMCIAIIIVEATVFVGCLAITRRRESDGDPSDDVPPSLVA